MTHSELATILTELEGQRQAFQQQKYYGVAEEFEKTIGRLCITNIVMIICGLKFWDAPLSLTKEAIEEAINRRKPPAPTEEQLKELNGQTS